jgi:hypothetical protein
MRLANFAEAVKSSESRQRDRLVGMIVAIADTHAAIWYLFSDPRLGTAASAFIDQRSPPAAISAFLPSQSQKWSTSSRKDASRTGAFNDLRAATADPATRLWSVLCTCVEANKRLESREITKM